MELDEKKVLEIIKNNPELIQKIVKSVQPKPSNNRKLNDILYDQLSVAFHSKTPYYLNHIRASVTSVMRQTLSIGKSKEVPDDKYELAKQFYTDLTELIKKYRNKI